MYLDVVYNKPKTDYPAKLVMYLIGRFNLGGELLELGSGKGELLDEFDVLLDVEDLEKERGFDINNHFPYRNNRFDIVFHKSVIEHIHNPDNMMRESRRVLKPGGKLIFLTPDWHSQWKNFYEDHTHVQPYDKLAVENLLKIYNFSNLTVEKFYQLPILWKYPMLRLPINTPTGRWLTEKTGLNYFRWSAESMILGYGEKNG